MASGIEWSGSLTARTNQFGPKVKRAMVVGANKIAPDAQQHMRTNAPWTDRTGNARNGLKTAVEVQRNAVIIHLYHSVPYGPYLETRHSGKFQIINPTIEQYAPKLVLLISQLAFD